MGVDGSPPPNVTEHHHYLLPPDPEGRFRPQYDGYGRYKLPAPKTGKLTSYTRVTTLSKTLDDTYNIEKWSKRNMLAGLVDNPEILAEGRSLIESGKASKGTLDKLNDRAEIAAGSKESAEFGTAVHAWLEAVDRGDLLACQVPEMYRDHVMYYLTRLANRGIVALPEYTERIVLNTDAMVVGTLDRIYLLPDGSLCMGDVKTSRELTYGKLTWAIQLDAYLDADYILSVDGTTWEPMPELRKDYAVLMHCPSDNPAATEAVTFDMDFGREALATAVKVYKLRKRAKDEVTHRHATPVPTAEYSRQQQAVLAIRTLSDPDGLAAIWEQYQDVWNDDLTDLGNAVAAVLTTL